MMATRCKMSCGWLLAVLLVIAPLFSGNSAQAACTSQGCVLAGPRLATIDTTQGPLLNALLGNLLGSSVNVNLLDWQNIAGGNINVAQMLNLLQVPLSVSTPAQTLTANATLLQVLTAAAGASVGGNAATVAASLANIAVPLSVPINTIQLGDLLKITGAAGQTSINALDLVMGSVQLYNYRNVVTTNTPVTIGVAGVTGVNNITLAAQVVEPPTYVCGPTGTAFHSAAIRVKLNLTLPAQAPLLNVLDSILGVANSSVTLGSAISVYVEVARAEGTLGTINALSNTFSAQVSPGVADLYIGSISDNVFFNRVTTLSQASFTPAPFGTLSLTALGIVSVTGTIGIKAYARGGLPSPTNMNFSPPYSQTQTAYTGAGFAAGLVTTLLSNLSVTVTLNLLPILNLDLSVSGLLKPIISGVLSPILTTLTSVVIDPLLNLLGIKLGEAVVTAYGTYSLCGVTGNVYSDANHNSFKDSTESGTGQTLYAKLIQTSYPTRALQVATVNTSTGAYSFSNVSTDTYSVLIDNSNTVTDVVVTMPTGWMPTEVPTMIRSLSVATRDEPNQNFGLFNGSKLTGRVFRDDGTGSGSIANNVVREVNETALPGVPVRITNSAGNTIYDSTNTLDDGAYTLWIPAAAGATSLKLTETNTALYISTGAAVGNTGGTYDRATDTITFTNAIGTVYANVNFGDVPANRFDTDGRQSVLPGNVAFYPHRFVAGTTGVITFTGSAPATAGWSYTLFQDLNCDGAINGADARITGGIAVVAAQNVCILARVFASETAAYNEQYPLTLSATFALANSALSDALARNDLTVVGDAGEAGFLLTKAVDRATALPGQILIYTITYTNRSLGPLTTIKIYDTTPDYTVFTSAACGTLATGLTGCTLTKVPTVSTAGAIEWTLAGSLLPGATGTVTFQVTIQ
ncbi:hypothetical protein [Steroidobacter sp.]|uniref:hypothetical protein n=1 Tax=Steroidobacter sp. TaxID=1978227 RepID=UPI0025CFBDC4|nr:hypothetical protein [Steroidobacter sp.]